MQLGSFFLQIGEILLLFLVQARRAWKGDLVSLGTIQQKNKKTNKTKIELLPKRLTLITFSWTNFTYTRTPL